MHSQIILNVVLYIICVPTFGHLVKNKLFDTVEISLNEINQNDFQNENEQCYHQLMAILNGITKFDKWALEGNTFLVVYHLMVNF